MIRRDLRGGYRILDLARRMGWLDRVVRYPLSGEVAIEVPLFREDNWCDAADIQEYESNLMEMVARIARGWPGPITLIDGGADIGMFAMRMVVACPAIAVVHAIEPNPLAYSWLCRNLEKLSIESHPRCAALGEQRGTGELKSPDYDDSDHGKYVAPSAGGTTPIERIDDLLATNSSENLVVKLDVEGAELPALRGAQRAISTARRVVVAFESHPRVAKRTGVDPCECMRLLSSLRCFDFQIAEFPEIRLRDDRSVFEQMSKPQNCNIVAVSTNHEP